MSDHKIKKISSMNEVDPDDEDAITFFLQYNESMTQIMVTLNTKRAMTPEEYINALSDFVNEVSEHPANLFVEDMPDDTGLH
jgi:hypothetical protein